jgi:Icc-related predicted phosphoesterase
LKKEDHVLARNFIRENTKLEFASAGDSHGDVRKLERFVKDCLAEDNVSLIIATGDYQRQPTKDFVEARENVSSILSILRGCPKTVLVLGGNYELPGVTADVASEIGEPLFSIGCSPSKANKRHPGNYLSFGGFDFIGVEGSNEINGLFPGERSDEELEWALFEAGKSAGIVDFRRTILVTHSPPYGIGRRDELGPFGLPGEYCGKHVGSVAYRNFILNQRPLIHDCGHVHEGVGATVCLWNRSPQGSTEYADVSMVEYEKIALLLRKDEARQVTVCVNHGTLEHWVYFRYRIAETQDYVGIEVAKRRLGGKDAFSRFTDKFVERPLYKRIFLRNVDLREVACAK